MLGLCKISIGYGWIAKNDFAQKSKFRCFFDLFLGNVSEALGVTLLVFVALQTGSKNNGLARKYPNQKAKAGGGNLSGQIFAGR